VQLLAALTPATAASKGFEVVFYEKLVQVMVV
jgi:hypothetical protein